MYAQYLARLLAPLGVYDLREDSVSGAMVCALGAALMHLLGQEGVSCSAEAIEAALLACGIPATLEMSGQNRVTITAPAGTQDNAELNLLIRGLVPAHLGIQWAAGE